MCVSDIGEQIVSGVGHDSDFWLGLVIAAG